MKKINLFEANAFSDKAMKKFLVRDSPYFFGPFKPGKIPKPFMGIEMFLTEYHPLFRA